MAKELAAEGHTTPVVIAGVNRYSQSSANDQMCDGRDIPWLQDEMAIDVWTAWKVEYRDVIILDAENRPIATFNLTNQDLGDPANYATLKKLFADAAK